MSALEELRAVVAEQKRRKDEELAAEKKQRQQERFEQFQRAVTTRCSLELLSELQAEFQDINPPHLRLIYRGRSQRWQVGDSFISTLPHSIAGWVNQVDSFLAEEECIRLEVKKEIVETLNDAQLSVHQLDRAKATVEKYGLMEFPSVYDAMQAAVERVDEIRRQEEAQARKAAEDLLTEVLETTFEVGWSSRLEILERNLIHMDYNLIGQTLVDEILDAIEVTGKRLLEEYEQRETQRRQAQAEAFYSFYVYRVHYALVAVEDGEQCVDTRSIMSLSPDPDDGWYVDVHSTQRQRLSHVCRVEQFVISEPENIPWWCPTRDTEWGTIRVPPSNAECIVL